MRVLYITYDGLTDPLGQSQVMPYLLGTAADGHEITILSFEKPDRFALLGSDVERRCAEAGMRWVPQRFRSRPPYLAKAIDQATMRGNALKLAAEGNFDAVHCRSYPATVAGLAVKQRHGTKLIFDMRGFWPDSRREGGRWNASNPLGALLYRRWKQLEARFIAHSDHIVTLAHTAQSEIETWDSYRGAPISVIPCCADFELFRPSPAKERANTRRELGFGDHEPVLLYVGSLGTIYRLSDHLRLFAAIRERDRNARMLFVGRHDVEDIRDQAAALGIPLEPRDLAVVSAERPEMSKWISAGDVGTCFILPKYFSLAVSPTKLGEYLACGVPTIANSNVGDVEAQVEAVDGGHVLKEFSEAEFSEAAGAFFRLLDRDRAEIRENARKLLDLPLAIDAYRRIYSDMSKAAVAGAA